MRQEITAKLPMDKRRIRSEAIDRFLGDAMKKFLDSLDHAFMLRILKKELECKKNEIPSQFSGEGEIRSRFLSKEECGNLVSDYFIGINFRYIEDPLYIITGAFPALVIDLPSLRIIVSVDRAAEALLSEKRAELTLALLGEIEDVTLAAASPAEASGGGNG
jgi:hypothetical protein